MSRRRLSSAFSCSSTFALSVLTLLSALLSLASSCSAPGFIGNGGDGAGEQPYLAAKLADAPRPSLGYVLGEPRHVGLNVAQVRAQHLVLAERVLRDRRKPGERRLQLHLILGHTHHQRLSG